MDEFAVLTKEMTEGELKAAASAFDTKAQSRSDYGIKQMIRAVLQPVIGSWPGCKMFIDPYAQAHRPYSIAPWQHFHSK